MDSTECVRVGVIMQRMGFVKNPKAMFEALIRCDESVLDTDDLDNLRRSFPSKATRDAVRRLPAEQLGDCDAFVRSLDSIPKLEERLQCMVFARRFVLRSGLAFCAKSVELRTILLTLLRAGNVLNQDS